MRRSFEIKESRPEPNDLRVEVELNQPFYAPGQQGPLEKHCLTVSETASGEMVRVTLNYLKKYHHRVPGTPQEEMRQRLAGTELRDYHAAQILRAVVKSGWTPQQETHIDCERVREILLPAWEDGTLNLRQEGPVGPTGQQGPIGHRGPRGMLVPKFVDTNEK